jgi:hypothetical protein
MNTKEKAANVPAPAATTLTGQLSLMTNFRPIGYQYSTIRRKRQIVDVRSQLIALADWVLEQERKARARALTAQDEQQAQAALEQAAQWAEGREALLEALGGGR